MIVLDTSFLIGASSAKDAHHAMATAANLTLAAGVWGPGLLLEYVFLETMGVVLKRAGLAAAQAEGRALLEAPELTLVPCADLWLRTWTEFAAQTATSLSFADVAVVQFALQHAAGLVLGFDQEFRKVPGITLLPATR